LQLHNFLGYGWYKTLLVGKEVVVPTHFHGWMPANQRYLQAVAKALSEPVLVASWALLISSMNLKLLGTILSEI
jgi:hypothetical protein